VEDRSRLIFSESEKAVARYDEWLQLREQAIANHKAGGSTDPLPRSLTDTPPPRPPPFMEDDMDGSVDMTANGFDASESFTLDRSIADDMVPNADPELERQPVSESQTRLTA
jgi:serine/threonine-protein phosphatase 2A regulatory subunit B'